MADLKNTVWVYDAAGVAVMFQPGDTIPDWAVAKMDDHCFVDGERPVEKPKRAPARKRADPK